MGINMAMGTRDLKTDEFLLLEHTHGFINGKKTAGTGTPSVPQIFARLVSRGVKPF
jgi:hypothetical protein